MLKRSFLSVFGVLALSACTLIPGLGGFTALGSQEDIDAFLENVAEAFSNKEDFRMMGEADGSSVDFSYKNGMLAYKVTSDEGTVQIFQDDSNTYMGLEQAGETQWIKYPNTEEEADTADVDLRGELLSTLKGEDGSTIEYVGLVDCSSPSGQCQEFKLTDSGEEGSMLFGAGDYLPYSYSAAISGADGDPVPAEFTLSYNDVPDVSIPQEALDAQSFEDLLNSL